MIRWLRSRPRCVTIIEPYLAGHRSDQLIAIRGILSDSGISSDHRISVWPGAFTRNPLLFPTVDGLFLTFLLTAPIRTIFLLRTVAIWHRPKYSTEGRSLKHFTKYYAARLIKHVPLVALISVQEPQHEPEISCLFNNWIYQIAQWHKPSKVAAHEGDPKSFEMAIRRHADGRPILVYLGEISDEKGFAFFTEILIEAVRSGNELAFVAAGNINQDSTHVAQRFVAAGGMLVAHYISDCEFLTAIAVADWVWACYRPDNDQNSGVFGLAYQAGSKTIVRRGSFVARMAADLGFPTVKIGYGAAKIALDAIRTSRSLKAEKPQQELIRMMKDKTRERLLYYLGFEKPSSGREHYRTAT
jgi:glycosyltransferase involved in cell wall biosynthesis